MPNKHLRHTAFAIVVLTWVHPANAELVFDASFTATFPTGSVLPSISGSFIGNFDDSGITGSTTGNFNGVLNSITLTPSVIGAITFSLSNSGIEVAYFGGNLVAVAFGGTVVDSAGTISSGNDDFSVLFSDDGCRTATGCTGLVFDEATYSIATETGIMPSVTPSSGSISVIPLPPAIWLLAPAMAGLAFSRRKTQ